MFAQNYVLQYSCLILIICLNSPGQRVPERNSNERILNISQISETGVPPSNTDESNTEETPF